MGNFKHNSQQGSKVLLFHKSIVIFALLKTAIIFSTILSVNGIPGPHLQKLPKELREMVLNKTLVKLSRSDLIPDLPQVLKLNETNFSADSDSVKGNLILTNTVANGLNALVDDININLVTMKAAASVTIPSTVQITGEYSLDAKINPGEDESISVSGYGPFRLIVTNLNMGIDAKIDIALLTGKMSVSNMDVQLSFDSISANADNFVLNDETVEWDTVNTELNENFDTIWNQYQEALTLALTEGFNELISDLSFSEVLDLIAGKKTIEQLIKSAQNSQKAQ